jgi:predicted dehydrogenase/threonine dehydrogenase-like Zn-dependent dehydrogenase
VKQVTQRLRNGRIEVLDVPEPVLLPDGVIVDVRASLISAGTERNKVETGRKSLVGKARSRPDDVRQVVEKARRDGIAETVHAVRTRLAEPSPLGYSCAGVVRTVGSRVRGLVPGDRVACGGDRAVHAEVDSVPAQLCVRLPGSVPFEAGAFATLGSIAMHGVRQADVRLGERVAVIGLGLVGQLTGQILRASGCSVVGIDLSSELVELALSSGAADVAYLRGDLDSSLPADAVDCDAVIVTAATSTSDPLVLAPELCRDRARVVLVGDVRIEFPRAPYYAKELDFRLSRSYGPGRYDREYEERGLDYPIGYVRWTERRNMAAFVDLLAAGRVDVTPLIRRRVEIAEADAAYEELLAGSSPLGIVIDYPQHEPALPTVPARRSAKPATSAVGLIGTGSFATRILVPSLAKSGFELRAVASASGVSAQAVAEGVDSARAVTPDELLADPELGLVVVATRHDSHAELAARALRAGKAVFVEKPPALDEEELQTLRAARDETGLPLAVGFNRRFAPLVRELRDHVRGHGPVELLYRVNAGRLAPDHWLNDPLVGGGRLVGEGCHFVDLACWLVGSRPSLVSAHVQPETDIAVAAAQSFVVSLRFPDGSLATILYSAGGASGLGKEYLEAHSEGRSAVLDDFRHLELRDGRRRRRVRGGGDKGHVAQFEHLRRVLAGEAVDDEPAPLDTMQVTLEALRAAAGGAGEDA